MGMVARYGWQEAGRILGV